MKSCKSYTCKISGNKEKLKFLNETLEMIEDLSLVCFVLGTKCSKKYWTDQKKLYHYCRKLFPDLNSKILQNFISLYQPKGKRKLPKHRAIKPAIFIDQNFNIKINNSNKLTNYWLRFSRRNFPLLGEEILKKLKILQKLN